MQTLHVVYLELMYHQLCYFTLKYGQMFFQIVTIVFSFAGSAEMMIGHIPYACTTCNQEHSSIIIACRIACHYPSIELPIMSVMSKENDCCVKMVFGTGLIATTY